MAACFLAERSFPLNMNLFYKAEIKSSPEDGVAPLPLHLALKFAEKNLVKSPYHLRPSGQGQ